MKFSVVIPARDEERRIGACLDSIERAAAAFFGNVEVIVVINRCTDSTAIVAKKRGAVLVFDDSRNLAKIRNAGAAKASGDILVTIDADSQMSENTLQEIDKAMQSGKYIGGGVALRPERVSPGIWLTFLLLGIFLRLTGLSAGLYWCDRWSFEAIGGFNEMRLVGEDLDFAHRLKIYGWKRGLKLGTLRRSFITTSCRKFDRFGDWYAFTFAVFHGRAIYRGLRGHDTAFADRYFYDFKRD